MQNLQWSALEYEEKERSSDWFWALGVIVATSSIAAIIFENYFFAGLLLLAGVLLWFFAKKKPDVVTYEINSKGIKIRNSVYLYEGIKSFWIQTGSHNEETESQPKFFIKSERIFMPIISIPIELNSAEKIRSILLEKNILEEEMREHASEKIMDMLGF